MGIKDWRGMGKNKGIGARVSQPTAQPTNETKRNKDKFILYESVQVIMNFIDEKTFNIT